LNDIPHVEIESEVIKNRWIKLKENEPFTI
jgi:hypothetical protein